jgi:hypothetical protein
MASLGRAETGGRETSKPSDARGSLCIPDKGYSKEKMARSPEPRRPCPASPCAPAYGLRSVACRAWAAAKEGKEKWGLGSRCFS